MNKSEFTWWLHGWFEIQNPTTINASQLQEIKNHLALTKAPQTVTNPIEAPHLSGLDPKFYYNFGIDTTYILVTKNPHFWSGATWEILDSKFGHSLAEEAYGVLIPSGRNGIRVLADNTIDKDYTNLSYYNESLIVGPNRNGVGLWNIGPNHNNSQLYC